MTKRWVNRPEGSTWGDWGDDDQLGRVNLLTPERVKAAVAEVIILHRTTDAPCSKADLSNCNIAEPPDRRKDQIGEIRSRDSLHLSVRADPVEDFLATDVKCSLADFLNRTMTGVQRPFYVPLRCRVSGTGGRILRA